MKLRLLEIAAIELSEAIRWYDAQAPGLGARFLSEIRAGGAKILSFPEAWHLLGDGVRRFRLRRFPYGMIYVIEGDEIVILAIAHQHRDPDFWRDRIKVR